ncbi:hypothetical protein V8F33_013209 [Rhypophila sp. PSN 637]
MSEQQDQVPMEFTGPERRFLEAMWAGFKTIPELDMHKVGAQMNMNHRSCANLWGQIKKKIIHNANCPTTPSGNNSEAGGSAAGTPAPKRKRATKKNDDANDDGSPAAKTPKTPRGRGKMVTDAEGNATPAASNKGRKGKAVKQEQDNDLVKEESVEAEENRETVTGHDEDAAAEVAQPGEV